MIQIPTTILSTLFLMALPWPEIRPVQDAAADDDRTQIQGAWLRTENVYNGHDTLNDEFDAFFDSEFVVIEGDRWFWLPKDKQGHHWLSISRVYGLTLDTKQRPKTFALAWRGIGVPLPERLEGENPARAGQSLDADVKPIAGIYRLEGDDLMICTGPSRPSDFTASKGSEREYTRFRRIVPQGPAAHPMPREAAAELDRLAGTWIPFVEIDSGHDETQVIPPPDWFLVIKGNQYIIRDPDENGRLDPESDSIRRLAIDPTQTPKSIDLIAPNDIVSRLVDEGIYRLDGDTLTICFGTRNRPATFEAPEGSGCYLCVYRRAKDPAPTKP